MAAFLLPAAMLAALAHCRGDGTTLFSAGGREREVALTAADFERAERMPLATLMRLGSEHGAQTDNAMYSARMFEGDLAGVRMSESGVLIYESGAGGRTNSPNGGQRNAVRDADMLWPGAVVPYAIDSRFGEESRAVIASGIAELEAKTCVRFVPRKKERHTDYVYITSKSGCFSHLGRTGRGRQILSLDTRGCVFKGIVEHELLHALGFLHEQSRTDRDAYIKILHQNIRRGMESQFKKYPAAVITDLGTAYDYGSVLHYGARAFSRNGRPTIRAKRAGVGFGQREGVSANDVLKVNRLYECDEKSGPIGQEWGNALVGVLAALAALGLLLLLACLCYRWLNHRWPDAGTVKRVAEKCATPSEWPTNHNKSPPNTKHQSQTKAAAAATKSRPNDYHADGKFAPADSTGPDGASTLHQGHYDCPQDPSQSHYQYGGDSEESAHYACSEVVQPGGEYAERRHYDTPADSGDGGRARPPPLPAKPPVAASQPGRVRGIAASFDRRPR